MRIYGDIYSGNCYKIKLLCSMLDIEHEWIHVDILAGETKTARFLALNAVGQIPVLELDDGRTLAESNAILNFLATDSELLPHDPFGRAEVLQWQFFEQYSHEPYIAVARYIKRYLQLPESRLDEYQSKQSGGHRALKVMDEHLQSNDYFVSQQLSIADISLYAYTHVADEGGFDLGEYRNILRWLQRVQSHPRYISMDVGSLA